MDILIAGDFCPQQRVAEYFEKKDYSRVLGDVKEIVENSSYSIVNFECPIVTGNEKPINKCGPNLSCSIQGIEAIKWAGFDCLTLANNHIRDYGHEGVINTINYCKEYNLDFVGAGKNAAEASAVLYKNIEDKRIAVINCCEREFSIATSTVSGSNPLNPIHQYYSIKEARKNADIVVVIVHGGYEHFQLPSNRMIETYRFFIDSGADAVINHHQHCYSGYEEYKGKLIFYGIGNFCFDNAEKRDAIWNFGYMVRLIFNKGIKCEILPYKQCSETATIQMIPFGDIESKLGEINRIIASKKLLEKELQKYYNECEKTIENILEPQNGRYISFLRRKHLFPSFITYDWLTKLYNYITCESHQEKVHHYIQKRI